MEYKKLAYPHISEEYMHKYLTNLSPNKASGIGNLSGKFLKDGANILALPDSQLCNSLYLYLHFHKIAQLLNLNPSSKKEVVQNLRIFGLFLFYFYVVFPKDLF